MTPAGRFTTELDPTAAKTYVAIAAGSGITPVLSIVAAILEGEPGSFVTLVYANRTSRSVMFLDEVHDLKDRFPERFQIVHVLSRETQDVELLSGRLDGDRLRRILETLVPGRRRRRLVPVRPAADGRRAPRRAHRPRGTPDPHRALPRRPGAAGAGRRARGRHRGRGGGDHPARRPRVRLQPAARRRTRARGGAPRALRPAVRVQGRRVRHLPRPAGRGHRADGRNYALEPEEIEKGYVLTCQSHPTSARVVLDYDA